MKDLSKSYNPKEYENKIYKLWESGKFFAPKDNPKKKPYVVTIPPPNVTGSLHMGHALNNTIQDVLVRWHRMMDNPTLWVPGTDHAGIATQNVVEKKLAKGGKTRFNLGRKKFMEEVWKWKDEYEEKILNQLKIMGCSCDWERTRFTMDKGYADAVLKSFIHYYKKGYLYRDYRIINWCPRCETSLSDLEVEYEEIQGNLWYINYNIEGGGKIMVATTRPETMLGDTAVAVNPKDRRYKTLVGKTAILPILKRKVPIVADEAVDMDFGTGAVKVTPAHDPLDFEIAERHNLPKIIVISEQGKMTKEAGEESVGLDRFEARENVTEMLGEGKWLQKTEPYNHNVGHCYRCRSVIEPLLSLQWFVSMKKIAKPAIDAVKKDEINFYPPRWKKVYLDWMENIKDWCVSRQIWWGHRIPVWYRNSKAKVKTPLDYARGKQNSKVGNQDIYVGIKPPKDAEKWIQDPDVLDTWFSSALWPFAVLGWPEKSPDMKNYYPTTLLSTARDIIYLWVARMIMSGYEFTSKKPFSDVYIHATVFNKEGKRMSKSLGTGVDPLELIEKYGADAMRFGLLWQAAQGQDMKFSEEAILGAQRFANKTWNASRFVMMNLKDYKKTTLDKVKSKLRKEDKKILSDFKKIVEQTNKYLKNYDFQHAMENLYEFFWHNFCDKYIETAKKRVRENKEKISAQYCLDYVLKGSLKLLHPAMPHVTEAIWQNLEEEKPLIISEWPKP